MQCIGQSSLHKKVLRMLKKVDKRCLHTTYVYRNISINIYIHHVPLCMFYACMKVQMKVQ